MAVAVADYMEGTMRINLTQSGGLSRKFKLNTATIADAKNRMKELCEAQAHMLPLDANIFSATCSLKSKVRDRYIPQGIIRSGVNLGAEMAAPGPTNMPQDGILVKFDTLEGPSSELLIRLLRDDWITGYVPLAALLIVLNGPFAYGAVVAAGNSYLTAWTHLLTTIGANCCFYRKRTAAQILVDPVNIWDKYTYKRIQVLRCGTRDFGKGAQAGRGRRKRTV